MVTSEHVGFEFGVFDGFEGLILFDLR
jgi:hypothetical protein